MSQLPALTVWRRGTWRTVRVDNSWDMDDLHLGAEIRKQEEVTETPNLPVLWVEKLPVVWVKPRTFRIERAPKFPDRDVVGMDEFPWYVEETTHGDDRDDYGRAATWEEAVRLVGQMRNGVRYGAK